MEAGTKMLIMDGKIRMWRESFRGRYPEETFNRVRFLI